METLYKVITDKVLINLKAGLYDTIMYSTRSFAVFVPYRVDVSFFEFKAVVFQRRAQPTCSHLRF